MKVGIIFAMEEELRELRKYLNLNREYDIYDLHFLEGKIGNVVCFLVQSGVGKVNAARTTQVLIDNFKVDYIFNIGVAGGISEKLKVGDIVVGDSLVQHDFDITAFNHEKGYIPKVGKCINVDPRLVRIVKDVFDSNKMRYLCGTIATGDIFCTDVNKTEEIYKTFGAICVEMEGAAVAQTAFLSGVPFLILRSISDVPNNDNVMTYNEFLESSCKIIAEAMEKILLRL